MIEKFLEWLEKKRQFDMELQTEKGEGWDAEDEAAYNDLKYYLSTSASANKETRQGTERMRLDGLPWAALGDSKRIELLRTCVSLLALAVSSGAEYFLQQVVEKLSPEGGD